MVSGGWQWNWKLLFDVLITRFYNATNGQCSKFKYTGCAGNKNNFATESECMEVSVTCDLGHVYP